MKNYLKEFFKDKFNIILVIFQAIALICFAFSKVSAVCTIIFLILECVFFILWGIKTFLNIKKLRENQKVCEELPYTEEQIQLLKKTTENEIKNCKFKAIMFICLGVVLLISVISSFV